MIQRSRDRWAVMISGRGSNLQNALEYSEDLHIPWVVSSQRKASGVFKARRFGCHTAYLRTPTEPSATRRNSTTWPIGLSGFVLSDFDSLLSFWRQQKTEQMFLMGFMKIIPGAFIQKFRGMIFNVHPSLLPAYPGKDSFQRALADDAPLGATVHEVNERVDDGLQWVKHRVQKNGRKERDHFFRLSIVERKIVLRVLFKQLTTWKKIKRSL